MKQLDGKDIKATYTPAEVARLTGRPFSTVYKWVDTGKLPSVMLGDQRVVPLTALLGVWESIRLAKALSAA